MGMNLPNFVHEVSAAVSLAGGVPYVVGGAVRDHLLGLPSKDYDLVVFGLTMDRLKSALPFRKDEVGASFGILKVSNGEMTLDVALPRTERSFGVGHRDFAITIDPTLSLVVDAARRDLTIGAVYYNVATGEFVDPFDGQSDLRNKLIRFVGRPQERINEDPVRMLRAIRIGAKLNFELTDDTIAAIHDNAELLSTVAAERVYDEFCKILMGPNAVDAIKAMVLLRMMNYIIPEWEASVSFNQNNRHHDLPVDQHVLKALQYAIDHGAGLRCRWAVLLHDISKPATMTTDEKGMSHFYRHEDVGSPVAASILARLRAPADLTSDVAKIVFNHLRPPREASDKTLRKYIAEMGDLTEDGLLCKEADMYAHVDGEANAKTIQVYRERIKAFQEISGFKESDVALDGNTIHELFGVSGKEVGRLKKLCRDAVIEGVIANDKASLLEFLKLRLTNA